MTPHNIHDTLSSQAVLYVKRSADWQTPEINTCAAGRGGRHLDAIDAGRSGGVVRGHTDQSTLVHLAETVRQ